MFKIVQGPAICLTNHSEPCVCCKGFQKNHTKTEEDKVSQDNEDAEAVVEDHHRGERFWEDSMFGGYGTMRGHWGN